MNNFSKTELYLQISKKYDLKKLDMFNMPFDAYQNILAYVLDISVINLKLKSEISISKSQMEMLEDILDKMCNQNIPFEYITKKVYIYNEEYVVSEDTLIPRQDTECIIETAINKINEKHYESMLDLCTGSGVIGISTCANSKIKSCLMTDISAPAIKIADKNIVINKMEGKCKTKVSDLFANINPLDTFDIITANPPYISEKDYEKLSVYVKKEPYIALVTGNNGLQMYSKIAAEAKKHLNEDGCLMFEIGYDEAAAVVNILKQNGYINIQVVKDINSKDRVVMCHFQKK